MQPDYEGVCAECGTINAEKGPPRRSCSTAPPCKYCSAQLNGTAPTPSDRERSGEQSELVGLLVKANIDYAHDCNTRGWAEVGRELSQYQADAILAAGFSRPRPWREARLTGFDASEEVDASVIRLTFDLPRENLPTIAIGDRWALCANPTVAACGAGSERVRESFYMEDNDYMRAVRFYGVAAGDMRAMAECVLRAARTAPEPKQEERP